jgi:hypothetical protein
MSNSNLLWLILRHMDSASDNVRIGCVWTVINLVVTEETLVARSSPPAVFPLILAECRARAKTLKDMGFFEKLMKMKESDSSLDVKERAKSALAHLDGLNV